MGGEGEKGELLRDVDQKTKDVFRVRRLDPGDGPKVTPVCRDQAGSNLGAVVEVVGEPK